MGLGLYDSYWLDKSSCTKYSDDWIDNVEYIGAHKRIFNTSYSMAVLLLLTVSLFVYVIFLVDDGFAYQRLAKAIVLCVQMKSRSFLPTISMICLSCIIWYLSSILYLPNAHTIPLCFPTPPSYLS